MNIRYESNTSEVIGQLQSEIDHIIQSYIDHLKEELKSMEVEMDQEGATVTITKTAEGNFNFKIIASPELTEKIENIINQ